MAATVSAWAKPGARALDSEGHEVELLQEQKEEPASTNHYSNVGEASAAGLSDFPSLATAAATKTKKKSKGQTLSLQEFASFGSVKQPTFQAPVSKGLTPDELLVLPTGPRQRSAEELDRSKLGGGFRSYGSSYDRPRGGSSDEQPRRQRDSNRDFAPSRADEIDDWGATKKSTVGNGFERRDRGERGAFFSDSQSRADEVDNWASKKTFVPSEGRRYDRRGGFDSNSGGADTENWTKRKEEEGRRIGASGGAFDSLRERRGGVFEATNGGGLDSDKWGRKREEGSGRPRLNLQPRTLPVGEGQQENGSAAKPKGSNPFGDARPREEVLKQKGQDPKEIEEKLESVKIKDAAGSDGPSPGKKSFGSGNWRGSFPEDRTARTWRKPEPVDACPPSADKTEDRPVEEAVDRDPQE